jgi:hypothetical protein
MRNLRNANQPPSGTLVSNYLQSSYDIVSAVYDNLAMLGRIDTGLTEGSLGQYLTAAEIDTLAELNAIVADATLGTATDFASAAQGAKVDFLTVTQPVDLDSLETRVNELDASVVLKGSWDASAGTFPGAGAAMSGHSWIVSTGGIVDSVAFTANDRIVAIKDSASTTTYASNWLILDYSDAVLSVAGLTGAISAAGLRTAINVENGATADMTGSEISTALYAESDTNKFTDAWLTKLTNIETAATADQTDAEIETAYNAQVTVVTQVEAETGTSTAVRRWTPERVKQAIVALGGGGGGGGLAVEFKTASFTAVAGKKYKIDTTTATGDVTVTLPAGSDGNNIAIQDTGHNASVNNIIINPNGAETIDGTTTFVIDQNEGDVDLGYKASGTNWEVSSDGTVDVVNVEAYVTGAETFLIRPGDMVAAVGSVAQVAAGVVGGNYKVHALSFGAGVYESAAFPVIMPQRWDEGQFRFRLLWNPTSVNTGNVYWGMYGDSAISGATSINDDSVGAGLSPLAANGTADSPHLTPWSGWFSWDDTPALDEILYLRVQRNGGDATDTYTGEAELQLVELQWVSNAATDD